MSAYIERPLKDKDSNEYLKSMGFSLQPNCFGSFWEGHGQWFILNPDTIIRNLCQLLNHFKKDSYDTAYSRGKADAIATMYDKMNELVFPPPEVNDNRLTVE